MKSRLAGLLFGFLLFSAAGFLGCGEAPPCDTSLITLDETRLDAETYEKEAAETAKRIAQLEDRLAKKKMEIKELEKKFPEMKKKVYELKKGSGRE